MQWRARIDHARPIVRLADVEGELHDDLVRVGARNVHVVVFEPERATGLLAEAGTAGARLTWEIVMTRTATPIGWLLTDPNGDARRAYERLGFREVATIASTLRPFDASTLRTRPGRSSPARSRGSRTMAR